jgi:hypothetical protein
VITGFHGWAAFKSMNVGVGPRAIRIVPLFLLLPWGGVAFSQSAPDVLKGMKHSASLTFMKKDGTCVDGPISKIDPNAVTIQQIQKPPVTILRNDLVQVSQGDVLVFSARSSWADVQAVHLLPRESFTLKIRNGKVIEGRPFRVDADSIVFKRGFWMKKRYGKDQILTMDYLRVKPESDVFDYFAQEAPALLFFYPEFYDRLSGLEGRIPVRLYDALLSEDDTQLKCSRH